MLPESSSEDTATLGNEDAASNANQDVNSSAESSAAGTGVEKPSFLSSVEAALKGTGKEESPASESGKETAKPDAKASGAAEGDKEKSELTEDEIKSYPPNSQRRIRELVAQRDDGRRQNESLKPRAEQFDRIAAYMREKSITPGDFDNSLNIAGLINTGQYAKALQALEPVYRELALRAGEVLPKDLQEAVRLGKIDLATARDYSKTRANAAAAEQRESRNQQRTVQEQEQTRVTEMVNTVSKSADDWAKAKATSDPDWSLKQKDVAEQVELELARLGPRGYPKTPQEAIIISEKALKTVEARIQTWKPKPEAKRTTNGQFASPHSKAQPKTFMEAVQGALAK